MAIKVILTDAGIQALINKQKDGTNALVLSSVQFGTGKYTASEDQTALREPFKTLNTIKGGNIGDNLIHVGIRDTDYEKYEVYDIGVFTADGILFAVYAQDTPIMQKAAPTHALFTFEFPVASASPDDIVVEGEGGFWNPSATTETQGIVELATRQETIDGIDNRRAVTPDGLKAALQPFVTYDFIDSIGDVILVGTSDSVKYSELQSN